VNLSAAQRVISAYSELETAVDTLVQPPGSRSTLLRACKPAATGLHVLRE